MGIKLGSVVVLLMVCFIAKISFESVTNKKNPEPLNEKVSYSIDKSYQDHLNKK